MSSKRRSSWLLEADCACRAGSHLTSRQEITGLYLLGDDRGLQPVAYIPVQMLDSLPPDYTTMIVATATTAVESEFEVGIGYSDPLGAEERRRLMDVIKALYGTGIQSDIDVPMIAAVGSQSSGKSSLIEAISGITLPRSVGTCTRCPIECHLFRAPEPWSCQVSLRFLTDSQGLRYSQARNVSFGDIITNPLQVEERIRCAQAAVLTPDESPESFLNKRLQDLTPSAATFTANIVSLEIRGPKIQEELSFIDLPGLIRNVGSSGNAGDIILIEDLVKSYIVKPSCIILLTVACETDFANQEGYTMARTYDPEGVRTIGVLTKPDRIDVGGESRWLSFIRGEEEPLSNGWFCVKQPDAQGLIKNTSWEAARSEEAAFFSKNEVWSSLEHCYHNRLQTKNLFCNLSNLLSKVIKDRLPELKIEVRNLLDSTAVELGTLPKKSNDVVGDFFALILSFSRAVKDHVATLKDSGFLHQVKFEKGCFRREIHSTALDFRPWPRDKEDAFKKLTSPDFLGDDHSPLFGASTTDTPKGRRGSGSSEILDDRKVVFLDEVERQVYRASPRELSDSYPAEVRQDFACRCVDEWKDPTIRFVGRIAVMAYNAIYELVQEHFKHYTSGNIKRWILDVVSDHIEACKAKAIKHVEMLLLAEHSVDTGNTQDFRAYKDKFLAYYKSHRQQESGNSFFKTVDLKPYNPNASYAATAEFQAGMSMARSAFAKMGLPEVQPTDFAKIISPDRSETMLEIMASTSAYLQVAFKRFTDYVPLIVDRCLVHALTDNSLEEKLRGKINLSDRTTFDRCSDLLREPALLAETRGRLENQLARLKGAQQELFREGDDASVLFS